MAPEQTALFLSLKPQYAEMLLDGRKTVELRRVRPAAIPGSTVLLYASSPTKTLVGRAEVADIQVDSVDEIWSAYGDRTGITEDQFHAYFSGLDDAVAIKLRRIRRLERPRPLDDLRGRLTGFRPPQSYRYLDGQELAALI
jgi:predicted transcriptional regulator